MEYIIGAIIGSVATSVVIIALVLFENILRTEDDFKGKWR